MQHQFLQQLFLPHRKLLEDSLFLHLEYKSKDPVHYTKCHLIFLMKLEELFLCHFRGAEESEEGEWLTAMQIFNDLQQKTRDKLAINRIAAFGRTLRKLDILNKKSNRGTLYHLVRIEE